MIITEKAVSVNAQYVLTVLISKAATLPSPLLQWSLQLSSEETKPLPGLLSEIVLSS